MKAGRLKSGHPGRDRDGGREGGPGGCAAKGARPANRISWARNDRGRQEPAGPTLPPVSRSPRADAMDLLSRCHQQFATDGSLADFFFPSLRMAGLRDRHDEWFEDTWKRTTAIIDRYPACDNSRKTARTSC